MEIMENARLIMGTYILKAMNCGWVTSPFRSRWHPQITVATVEITFETDAKPSTTLASTEDSFPSL